MRIPEYVTLKGEGHYNTQLCFVTTYYDKGEIPDAFMTGKGNFAIEDLDFWALRARGFLHTDENSKGNILLKNLHMAYVKYIGPIEVQEMVYTMTAENASEPDDDFYTTDERDYGIRGLILYGDNVHIENCEFIFSNDKVKLVNGSGCVVMNNTFENTNYRGGGSDILAGLSESIWYGNESIGRIVVENVGSRISENLYIGANTIKMNFHGDRTGVSVTNGKNVVFEGNSLNHCGAVTMRGNLENVSIINNKFSHSRGIDIITETDAESKGINIFENSLEGCLYSGVREYQSVNDGLLGGIFLNVEGISQWNNINSNTILDNGYIGINAVGNLKDVILDGNSLNDADKGFSIEGDTAAYARVKFANNTFNAVDNQYKFAAGLDWNGRIEKID